MRSTRRFRGTTAGLAVLLAVALAPVSAGAQEAGSGIAIDAQFAMSGQIRTGAPAALSITVESARLLAGTLVVLADAPTGSVVVERAIEVPAGSKKVIRLTVPPSQNARIIIRDRKGRTVATKPAGALDPTSNEVVGVYAPSFTPPDTVALPSAERNVSPLTVSADIFDLGAAGLGQLSHLIVDAAAAEKLSPARRSAVIEWVARGGSLIAAGEETGWLPQAWRGKAGAFRSTPAGFGSVVVSPVPVSDAAWSRDGPLWRRAIRPTTVSQQQNDGGWMQSLIGSGAFSRSRLGWLLAFVIVYALAVGPVNFFVLSRIGRKELAWATIPILSIGFAAGAYVIGRGIRTGPVLQGTGIVVVEPSGFRSALALGAISRRGGQETVALPSGWQIEPLGGEEFFGFGRDMAIAAGPNGIRQNDQSRRILLDGDRQSMRFKLPVGGIGTLLASSSGRQQNAAAGTLTWNGSAFTGTVTNTSAFPLSNVTLFVGRSAEPLGNLEPKQRSDSIAITPKGQAINFEPFGWENGRPVATRNYALIQRAIQFAGLGQPGRAFLAGDADLPAVSKALGLPRTGGKVLVLIPLALNSPSSLHGEQIISDVIATNGNLTTFDGKVRALEGGNRMTVRFSIPAGSRPKTLELTIPPSPWGGPDGPGGALGATLTAFDARSGSWKTIDTTDDDNARIDGSLVSADGDLIVRLTWKQIGKVTVIPQLSEATP